MMSQVTMSHVTVSHGIMSSVMMSHIMISFIVMSHVSWCHVSLCHVSWCHVSWWQFHDVMMSAVSTHVSSVQPNILRQPFLTSQGSVWFWRQFKKRIFLNHIFYIQIWTYQMAPSNRVSDICGLPCSLVIEKVTLRYCPLCIWCILLLIWLWSCWKMS